MKLQKERFQKAHVHARTHARARDIRLRAMTDCASQSVRVLCERKQRREMTEKQDLLKLGAKNERNSEPRCLMSTRSVPGSSARGGWELVGLNGTARDTLQRLRQPPASCGCEPGIVSTSSSSVDSSSVLCSVVALCNQRGDGECEDVIRFLHVCDRGKCLRGKHMSPAQGILHFCLLQAVSAKQCNKIITISLTLWFNSGPPQQNFGRDKLVLPRIPVRSGSLSSAAGSTGPSLLRTLSLRLCFHWTRDSSPSPSFPATTDLRSSETNTTDLRMLASSAFVEHEHKR